MRLLNLLSVEDGEIIADIENIYDIPAAPGIYCFYDTEDWDDGEDGYSVAYLGKSCNLRDRILQHARFTSKSWAVRAGFTDWEAWTSRFSVQWVTLSNMDLADRIEPRMIQLLRPTYNIQHAA